MRPWFRLARVCQSVVTCYIVSCDTQRLLRPKCSAAIFVVQKFRFRFNLHSVSQKKVLFFFCSHSANKICVLISNPFSDTETNNIFIFIHIHHWHARTFRVWGIIHILVVCPRQIYNCTTINYKQIMMLLWLSFDRDDDIIIPDRKITYTLRAHCFSSRPVAASNSNRTASETGRALSPTYVLFALKTAYTESNSYVVLLIMLPLPQQQLLLPLLLPQSPLPSTPPLVLTYFRKSWNKIKTRQ